MLKGTNMPVYNFLYPKLGQFLHDIWKKAPPHILQKLCGPIVTLAEIGKNFDLAKTATLASLESSDGVINQQTTAEVPICYAAFLEQEKTDPKEALRYYLLAIDSIKFFSPPIFADLLVYRAALLTGFSSSFFFVSTEGIN